MIFVIDDDEIMAECIARNCGKDVRVFRDAVAAMGAMTTDALPNLIFLDILLTGPDGFTFLNELASYADTTKIPIVIVSSLDFSNQDLSGYGVVGILDKAKMTPVNIKEYVDRYVRSKK